MTGWILVYKHSGKPALDLFGCMTFYPTYRKAYKDKSDIVKIKKVTILELRRPNDHRTTNRKTKTSSSR